MGQTLKDIFNEAETSQDLENCVPCRIAAGIGVAANICQQFKELDCDKLANIIENPEVYSLEEAEDAIEEIRKGSDGEAKRLLDYTLSLMKGERSETTV